MSQATVSNPSIGSSNGGYPGVAEIETALAQGRDLHAWWNGAVQGSTQVDWFELASAGPGSEPVRGFFATAPVQGESVPVMGCIDDFFFDRPRVPANEQAAAAQWMLEQIEEFALHYWMRNRSWLLPEPYPELDRLQPPPLLQDFTLCNRSDPESAGLRDMQKLYKRSDGTVGEFPRKDQPAVIDLRRLGGEYEWVTVDGRLFDLKVSLGKANGINIDLPLDVTLHTVMSRDLVVNQRNPGTGVLGEFGPGWATVRRVSQRRGVANYGPDNVEPGFQQQSLRVLDSGEVRVRTVSIMRRLDKLMQVSGNPLDWGFKAIDVATLGTSRPLLDPVQQAMNKLPLAGFRIDPLMGPIRILNQITGNRAADELYISQAHFDKLILAKHAAAVRAMVLGSRQTWLQFPNWLAPNDLPQWVVLGQA